MAHHFSNAEMQELPNYEFSICDNIIQKWREKQKHPQGRENKEDLC